MWYQIDVVVCVMLNLECLSNLECALGSGKGKDSLTKLMSYFDLLCASKMVRDELRKKCVASSNSGFSDFFGGVSDSILVLLDSIDSVGCCNEFNYTLQLDFDDIYASLVVIWNSGFFSVFYHFLAFRFGYYVDRSETRVDAFDVFYLFVGYLFLDYIGLGGKVDWNKCLDLDDGITESKLLSILFRRMSNSGLCNYSELDSGFRMLEVRLDLFLFFDSFKDIIEDCACYNTCVDVVVSNQRVVYDYHNLLGYFEDSSVYLEDGTNIFSRLSDDFFDNIYRLSSVDFFNSILRGLVYGG